MRLLSSVAVILVLSAFASRAEAAKKTTGREALENSARKACMMGDYQKGIEILSDLFIETKVITYVYNQGRCLEQNHRWEEALDRFLEYQRKTPGVDETEKSEVEQHIVECKSHLKEQAAIAPPPVMPASPGPVAEPAAPAVVRAVAPVSTPERPGGMGLRVSGIAVGIVGIAAVATGVILATKTHALSDELNKTYNRDKAATRDSYETWGWVSYGVGAAALVAGTTLCIWGWQAGKSEPSEASTVSILPILIPGTGGVLLRGTY
jgi:hypothetical protein